MIGCPLYSLRPDPDLAFGAAEYFRQELAITCRREQGRPECRLVVHYRLAETELVFAAGELVAAGHEDASIATPRTT